MRPLVCSCATLLACLLLIACGSGEAATQSPSQTVNAIRSAPPTTASPTPTIGPTTVLTPEPTATPTLAPTSPPTPAPTPTVSPPPVNFNHPPPYTIALDPGHGGPYYSGEAAQDANGNWVVEKDLNLAVAQKLQALLTAAGYNVVMLRDSDTTITDFDPGDYSGSVEREEQARVDIANAANADAFVAIHFNGWTDSSDAGTESYCDPDRLFADDSCQLAWMIEQSLVIDVHADGYNLQDLGVKDDSDVGGDSWEPHSWDLGTNPDFRPTLMPGTIVETMFLSNPADLAFVERPEALDVIAGAYLKGINTYFAWLNGEVQ